MTKFSTLIGTTILTAGLLAVSMPNAMAANVKGNGNGNGNGGNGNGNGGNGNFSTAVCSITNITGADACAGGFAGNDTGNQGTALTKLNDDDVFGNLTWLLADKSDENSSIPGFTITNNAGSSNVPWSVTLPGSYNGPFVVSLKASNFYSLYYFQDLTTLSGVFTTAGVAIGNNNQSPGISHTSLFITEGTAIPEPLTMLGVGTAMGFGTFFKKRLAKAKKDKA